MNQELDVIDYDSALEGQDAHLASVRRDENPHRPNTIEHDSWAWGWDTMEELG